MTSICLRLYVTGRTVSAERARATLAVLESRLIADRGPGAVVSEVVDILETPEIAARDGVFATPTLVRYSPSPCVKVFGDLSSDTQLMVSLGLALGPQKARTSIADQKIPTPGVATSRQEFLIEKRY